MDHSIALPDLLCKLKVISYGHYQVERQQQQVFITLFAHQNTTRYLLLDPISQEKTGGTDLAAQPVSLLKTRPLHGERSAGQLLVEGASQLVGSIGPYTKKGPILSLLMSSLTWVIPQ